mgnify:CR=1 FL=1
MPSFIDMHVHFRYPGQTQKEDLQSGLSAAVAGGFGTVVLMPNTNPVVSSSDTAHQIEDEASSYNMADVIQTVSITKDFAGKTIKLGKDIVVNKDVKNPTSNWTQIGNTNKPFAGTFDGQGHTISGVYCYSKE